MSRIVQQVLLRIVLSTDAYPSNLFSETP